MQEHSTVWQSWLSARGNFLEEGLKAYPSYHRTLRNFSEFYGFGFVPTVEAFAALSPANDYHGNLRSLASLLHGIANGVPPKDITVSTFNSAAHRAYSYVTGEASFLDTVNGRKIRAFRDNILYLDKSREITIDGHMVGLWRGESLTMKEANLVLQRTGYDNVADDFLKYARKAKVAPCVFQATLWFYQKNSRQIKYSDQLDMFYSHGTKWVSDLDPADFPPYPTKKRV